MANIVRINNNYNNINRNNSNNSWNWEVALAYSFGDVEGIKRLNRWLAFLEETGRKPVEGLRL